MDIDINTKVDLLPFDKRSGKYGLMEKRLNGPMLRFMF